MPPEDERGLPPPEDRIADTDAAALPVDEGSDAPVESDQPPPVSPDVVPYTPTSSGDEGVYDDIKGYDHGYDHDYDHGDTPHSAETPAEVKSAPPSAIIPSAPSPPPPSPPVEEEEPDEEDDDGMLRMSFLGHLEELRTRLIHAIAGLAVAFILCLSFSENLWLIVQEPATAAFAKLGYKDVRLVQTAPMEAFSIVWVKLPLLIGIFAASPWLLYQIWAFVAPGLYKKERRFAAPFILCSALLFIIGGLFAYFVAFRFGLSFLLGIGRDIGIQPMITITEYFDIFVNVILGIAVVFELPILIFFLTLLRIASPRFLMRNSRYAVLAIVILAAFVTPTPDVINLMLFSGPMVLLYFLGVFASYLLVLSRENKRFPWKIVIVSVLIPLALLGLAGYLAVARYGYRFIGEWPFLVR